MKDNRRTQAERSASTRDALITAARPLFAERGYAEVGTEEIVRAAGVTRGALYHHFADKVEVFAAVFESVEAEVIAQIGAAVAEAQLPEPVAMMRLGARTWLDACTDPTIYRILLVDAPAVLGMERWREIGARYGMGLIQALLTHAIEAGRVSPQPVAPLAHTLLGALREGALYQATAPDKPQARADVGAVIDRMITALATM